MPSYSMEFSDINGDSSSTLTKTDRSRKPGCHVSYPAAFGLVLLAALLAVGVGLIVFLAMDRDLTCNVSGSEGVGSPESAFDAVKMCKEFVGEGGAVASDICTVCPSPTEAPVPDTTSSAAATTTTGPSPTYPRDRYRLPGNVKPYHYELTLQPNIYGPDPAQFDFHGSVIIHVTCLQATNSVTLHVNSLEIDPNDVSVKHASGSSVTIRNITYTKEPHFYTLELEGELIASEKYSIEFRKFSGPLSTDGQGLYYSFYQDGDQTVYLATTQFEAPHARKAFPCFDEPDMKATFDTVLVRKTDTGRDYITLSNMNILRSEVHGSGYVRDIYNRTMVMPTYLLAFVVCDYGSLSNMVLGTNYSTYARKNALEHAQRAQYHGLQDFTYFEERFTPNYSTVIKKLDNIAIPDFNAGAMENWGLITYREGLLYKEGVASASDEQWIAEVISHEIAHMWFGNIVSPKWWSWLWLNEAFASFWDFHSVDYLIPSWRMTDVSIAGGLHSVMSSDALASSHPMTADVETRAEVSSIFDAVTYTKGSFVVRMMNFIMGEDKFIEALNIYLNRHKYDTAEHSDLWRALDEVAISDLSVNMTEKMDPWVTQMGYPVVTVSKSQAGKLRLQQGRFLLGSEDNTDDRYKDPPYNYQWEIPITYTSSKNPNFDQTRTDIQWLQKDSTLDIDDPLAGETSGWYLVNVQQYGYFRVHYPLENWQALIAQLKEDHTIIHPINRGQIINDAWNLMKADLLDMSVALEILEYLSKETDYVPWRAFAREMDYVELMLDRSPLYPYLEKFMLTTVASPLQHLGLDITPSLPIIDVYVRVLVAQYACGYGHASCVNEAQRQFKDWTSSRVNGIDPNLRYQFYCTAIETGGAEEWEFVYTQYKAEDDASERSRLRRALGCTKEPSLLQRLLAMAMNASEVRTQDMRNTIEEVARNRWGRDLAFHFVVEHFSQLAGNMSASGMNRLISTVTLHFNTPYHLSLLTLLETIEGSSAYLPTLKSVRERTQTNMRWLQSHSEALQHWLLPPPPAERLSYRLPEGMVPSHYTVRLQPHIYGNDSSHFYFNGSCSILADCKIGGGRIITLHKDRLIVNDADVTVTKGQETRNLFDHSTYETERHLYHLHLNAPLEAGFQYTLTFDRFTGPLTSDGTGFYLSYYQDGPDTVYLATTQMEPPYARKTFPSFDEPALKAKFDISLVRRNDTGRNYTARANTPLMKTEMTTDAEGQTWWVDTFHTTPTMPTYLLAFLVSDFLCVEDMVTSADRQIPYRTCSRPNALQYTNRAQEYGIKLFHWLDSHFKPTYGAYMDKMDNAAVPDFNFGAMENWGLIIYREAILYEPNVTAATSQFWSGIVIAHEIAHMWFGDYVSPVWWDYIWLNEAFASWWEVFSTHSVFPDWKVIDEYWSGAVFNVMDSDALATSHPMTSEVQTPAEIMSMFDRVTYNKGAAVLRMIQLIMGFDNFVTALNNYLQKNLLGNARPEDLWSALDQQMVVNQSKPQGFMTEKMDPWVTQMGYPVVTVTKTTSGYQLSQQRFLIGSLQGTDPRFENPKYDYKWEIPITYATPMNPSMEKESRDIRWLTKNANLTIPDAMVNDTSHWVLVNPDQVGYFRVLYEDDNWGALVSQLNTDPGVFTPITRAQIINDAWSLAKAGMLNMSIALSTLDFLQSETELAPWRAFAKQMDYVELMLDRTSLSPDLKTFIQDSFRSPLSTLTLSIPADMVPVDVFVRTLIAKYSCTYGLIGCVNVAKRMFREWRDTGINQINANLRGQFYCTGVAEGGSADWEFVYSRYKQEAETTERNSLRQALSCSKDPLLLRRLLSMTLEQSEIRAQDVFSTISFITDNPAARDLAFQFFVDNFEAIKARLEGLFLGRALLAVTSHFNTDFNLQQLEQFIAVTDTTVIQSVVEQAVVQTRTNMKWMEDNMDVVRQWLTNREPPAAPEHTPGSYRLKYEVVPYHYDLWLKAHIYGNDSSQFYFEGGVTILVECKTETDVIVLHQDRLDINSSAISVRSVADGSEIPVSHVSQEVTFHFYKLHLASALQPGQSYTLHFPQFRGAFRWVGEGFYLSSYKDGDRTVYLATTQMEATYARQAFPCFDEPALKATFTTTLYRRTDTDREYITLSNMPLSTSTVQSADADGYVWTEDRFNRSMIMPTYLLAFVVCDYHYLSNMTNDPAGVETRVYARPNAMDSAVIPQKDSVEIFNWFNDRFKPTYGTYNKKVDHIVIQNFAAGAMENWGLITYREDSFLYNAMSRASIRSWIATVISHELAHMWFGNKVSPEWWDYLWLNEAFASYWETYAVEDLRPTWKSHSEVEMCSGIFYAMQVDGYTTSHPLSNPVETPSEINRQFSTITYTKGGGIIGMMHLIMGEHFIPALNLYLEKQLLGSANHTHLLSALDEYIATKSLGYSMSDIMESWIVQMGHPVVHAKRHNSSHLHLTQQRFLYSAAAAQADAQALGYKWNIPITYTTSQELNFNKSWTDIQWLRAEAPLSMELPSEGIDWFVINLRHKGIYRVNYDQDNWLALINQLNTDHTVIDPVNRATILDDAWNLVQADLLDLEIALKTTDYMSKELSYGPWRVFVRETNYLQRMIERTELFTHYQRFMQSILDGPLNHWGIDMPPSNEPPIEVFLRTWILADACEYGHKMCVQRAVNDVTDWMNQLGNKINVNSRMTFYCTAVREGGHGVWMFIYQAYQDETDAAEKSRLRNALGCSRDPTVLNTFLDMCLHDPEIPQDETRGCVESVASNRYGRDIALNFFLENYPHLLNSFSSAILGSMLSTVTQHFHTNYHLTQLHMLADTYDISSIRNNLETVKQRTVTNMKWMAKNFNTIKTWLESKVSDPSQVSDYRLPTSIRPLHYDLTLQPEIYSSDPSQFTFNGTVNIWINCTEATNVIVLHSYLLDFETLSDSATLLFENHTDSSLVTDVTYDSPRHFLRVHLARNLLEGETMVLHLEFAGTLRGDGVGLYYTSYQDGDKTVYLASTKFEAPYARRAFPCFDEPALKATFNTTLIRREVYNGRNYNTRSNNQLLRTTNLGNGYVADTFLQTPVTSTYLLAFMVSDFLCLENGTKHGLTYRTCARPNKYQYGALAQEYGVEMFEWLEDHFEPEYPMPKLDNVAVPDFLSGAMENWGLITYREDILYEQNVTTASDKQWTAEVVAHELAHMWFGNIVSPKWWNWLWLNEAFASFWDFSLVEKLKPTWRMVDQFAVVSLQGAMDVDGLQSSHPLTANVHSPNQIQAIFDTITYSKGAAIVRMMDFIMGEDHFIAALNVYLKNMEYDAAEHQDLWNALDEYSHQHNLGVNMSVVMDPWVTQMNYPVVHVHWSTDQSVTLTQQRFLTSGDGATDTAPYHYKWDIPITLASSSNPNFSVSNADIHWFYKTENQYTLASASIPQPTGSSWLILNANQYGYYRVNYDERNWRALIQELKNDPSVIPPINRGQIINDAWSLAKAGHLNMSIALETIDVLEFNSDYVPWRAMHRELSYLDLMLSTTSAYGKFEDYMVKVVNSTFHKIGMVNSANDTPIDIFQRERIVYYACKYGVAQCRQTASTEFMNWKNSNGSYSIDVDLQAVVLCNGLRFGSKEDWDFALTRYRMTRNSNVRSALACTTRGWQLDGLLELTLDSSVILPQDVRSVMQSVAANPAGRHKAWSFFINNYQALSKSMTPGSFGRMIRSLASHFNTQQQLDQVRNFMADNDVSLVQSSLSQVVEQTRLNMHWMHTHFQLTWDFLSQRS